MDSDLYYLIFLEDFLRHKLDIISATTRFTQTMQNHSISAVYLNILFSDSE